MKWVVYNLLFAAIFPFLLPGFLSRMFRRGGYRARMGDRFSLYPSEISAKLAEGRFVWIHAVSVGEVQVAGQLMRDWRKKDPAVRFCFSTTSSTGWKMAEREVSENDILIYNPLDFPTFVTAALRRINPVAIILTESEIWPIFIRSAAKKGIPLFLINARVSDRSAPRYAMARFFFKDVFRKFTRIFAQSELDKSRLVAAGAPEEIIDVTGSFKFDVAHRKIEKENELREWINPGERKIILGGSTWPGEDKVLLDIYSKICEKYDEADRPILVLAPRHFEKADAVEANIRAAGFDCIRRSHSPSPIPHSPFPIFLSDTTGELMGLYGIADFVFVGKSLCEHGSQNMIEPCLCGKPTVVGPYTENFRPVMSDLLEGDGIVQIKDAAELEKVIFEWLTDGDGGLGARAEKAVTRRLGVVPKCTDSIRSELTKAKPQKTAKTPTATRTILLTLLTVFLFAFILLLVLTWASARTDGRGLWKSKNREALDALAADIAKQKTMQATLPKMEAIINSAAFASLMVNPTAKTAYVADSSSTKYAPAFRLAGTKVLDAASAAKEKADIVFTTSIPRKLDWNSLAGHIAENGALACLVEVGKMNALRFKEILESFPCNETHLWMLGADDWLITGRLSDKKIPMDALLDFYSQADGRLSVEAEESGCGSLQCIFANYVGLREEVMPAFARGNLSNEVSPEFFIPEESPDIVWIDSDGIDEDIVSQLAMSIRTYQAIRRDVVRGGMLAKERKMDEAIALWRKANEANPRDLMLMDRMYKLVVNARAFKNFGKLAEAAQCYDVLFAIRPGDLRVADEYSAALAALRRYKEAKEVRKYADDIRLNAQRAEAEKLENLRKQIESAKNGGETNKGKEKE